MGEWIRLSPGKRRTALEKTKLKNKKGADYNLLAEGPRKAMDTISEPTPVGVSIQLIVLCPLKVSEVFNQDSKRSASNYIMKIAKLILLYRKSKQI